jgi:hypothetical protein
MQLRPYQAQAAQFLLANDSAMVLAPVGAGKTAMTLTAISIARKRMLVLAPLRVAEKVWPVEQPKWATGMTLAVATGTPTQRLKALRSGADIVVTNYDNLQWLSKQHLSFDGVVFDELTRLKNPSGARFKALFKIIEQFDIRWGLTGSFTSNGLEDVFGQCKIVDQSLLGRSKGAFLQQYFVCINKQFGEWAPRRGALDQVMERIKPATFLLDPGDYKDTLPPLHVVPQRVSMDMTDYKAMKKNFVLTYPTANVIAANAAVVTGKLQQIASGFVYDSSGGTELLSDHKLDALEDLHAENQRANTIVVYNFKAELEALQQRFPKAGTDTDAWNRGELEMLLIHPKSAGHGLNLQHGGHHMVFFSLPWSLELYEQTIGRLHRSGQTKPVWCYLLLTESTVDEDIYAALQDKRTLSDIAMDALK